MINQCKKNIFDNPRVKKEMLILRIRGYSSVTLARRYGVNHTTILYHCRQAGICITTQVRKQLFQFIKNGLCIIDVSRKLNIPEDVIKFYTEIYGNNGDKLFSRKAPHTPSQIIKLPPKVERPSGKSKEELPSTLTRTDSRGVEWVQDNRGNWICAGKPKEVIQFDEENKKKKALELKRLQMLSY